MQLLYIWFYCILNYNNIMLDKNKMIKINEMAIKCIKSNNEILNLNIAYFTLFMYFFSLIISF